MKFDTVISYWEIREFLKISRELTVVQIGDLKVHGVGNSNFEKARVGVDHDLHLNAISGMV